MKKTTSVLLALMMILSTLVSVIPAQAAIETLEEPIADYDKYGYYAYFDFEKCGDNNLNYVRSDASRNADGSLCDPFKFVLDGSGNFGGSGATLADENGNKFYRSTTDGKSDYKVGAVFGMQDDSGKSYILNEALEISFRFRMGTESTADGSARIGLVATRRGTSGGNYYHAQADIYGNVYAYVNGTMTLVYKNGDGQTKGGDGEFIDIRFIWFDTTNTYTLFINGEEVVSAMPLANNYRSSTYVTHVIDDDFMVADRKIVGASGTASKGGGDRTVEILRFDIKDVTIQWDLDDLKLSRYETAQRGAYYYENDFEGDYEGVSQLNARSNAYIYASPTASDIFVSEENGNKVLNVKSGHYFGLNDVDYQQFNHGNLVIEFSVKGKPTHTSGKKALVRINDTACMNMYKMLYIDPEGYLYTQADGNLRIDGVKLDGSEWVDVAIVAIKNLDNKGKFGTFSSSSQRSSYNLTYTLSYYINGKFVGTEKRDFSRWNNGTYFSGADRLRTTTGYKWTITDHTDALDLSALTLVDDTTTKNHKIYKSADSMTYYDVTFDENGNQTAYSMMVLSGKINGAEENIRFFTDSNMNAQLDNVRVYEGTAPETAYAAANSAKGGNILNVDFASFSFPTAGINASVRSSGSDAYGTLFNNAVVASSLVRKDANGNAITAATTMDSDYATASMGKGSWFDYYIPMPEKVNGAYDFTYSFKTTMKNIGLSKDGVTSASFFSHRFEKDGMGSAANPLMTITYNYYIYAGVNKAITLFDKNGKQAKFDNTVWNTFRIDINYKQNGSVTKLAASYYLNDEVLYLADGSPACNITEVFSEEQKARFGEANYRMRVTQMGTNQNITIDFKSVTVDALAKPVYTELGIETKINDKVSVIDFTLPKYTAKGASSYTALSLKKTTDDAEHTIPVISIGADKSVSAAFSGQYLALLDASGNAIKATDSLPMTVVYDDNTGFARYYVNGTPAYVNIGGKLTAAAELSVFDYDFTQLTGVGSADILVFAGFADDDSLLTANDYNVTISTVTNTDAAEIIGFQSSSVTDGLRLIAGVDTLCYTAVGFELETFVDGESKGVKNITSDTVFGSIIANDKTVTAEAYGYKYLSAAVITDIPENLDNGSYIVARSYADVNGYKHYDSKVKIVITDGGYYFDQNGTVYQNNFNGISALPAEFKLAGETSATASVTAKGEIEFKNNVNNAAFLLLNQFVGQNYVLQYDFTITEVNQNSGAYIGPAFGYVDGNNFAYAFTRTDNYTATGNPQGKIQAKVSGQWVNPDGNAFTVDDIGGVFEAGKAYTVSLACKNGHVAYFINGNLVAECDFENRSNAGLVGVCSKGATLLIDNLIVKTEEYAEDSYFVYSENFDNLSVIPETWKIAAGSAGSKATVTEDGKLRLIEPKGNYMIAAYNSDVGTDKYTLSADITVTAKESDGRYMGLSTNYKDRSNNVTAWIRYNGEGGISGRLNGASTDLATFNIADKGLSLSIGTTVNLKAECNGNNLKFYVDGILISEATIPADFTANKAGILTSGLNIDADNFTLSKLVEATASESYIQNFDSSASLPADWRAVDTNSTNKVSISDYTAMRVSSPADGVPQAYLNRNLQLDGVDVNDYVVEADITMIDNSNPNGYFGIIVRSTEPTTDGTTIRNGIYCAYRVSGQGGWIQGNNQSAHQYAATTPVSAFQNGETYKFKVVCQGNNVKFYVDDVLVADGDNPNNGMAFDKGTIGFSGKRVIFDVENVKVTTIGENPTVLFESEFNEGKNISDDWRIILCNNTFNISYTDRKGKLYVNAGDSGTLTHAVLDENAFDYDNYTVSADLTMKRVNNYMGLMLNYKSNSHYILTTLRNNGNVVLEAKTSTGWITIASGNIGKSLNVGDTYKISATVKDGMVYYYLDGTKVLEGATPEGYEEGTVGFGAKNVDVEVDNFTVVPVTTISEDDVIYSESFDTAPTAPSHWIHEEGAQRTNGVVPEIGVWATPSTPSDTSLRVEAMNSTLTVIALDKLFELDSFSFEADVAMLEKANISGVSYYMGPVFGIQEDSKCGLATMKVSEGTWNVEAWNTSKVAQSEQWTTFASGSFETTAVNTTYKMKVVGANGYVSFYVNGTLLTKCKVDEKFMDGNFGIALRNSEIEIDNVKICKGMEIFEVTNPETPSTRIRVASFNIGDFSTASGSSGDGIANGNGTEATKADYRAVFEKVGADIWGLQEDSKYFNGSTKESPYDAIYSVVHAEYERNFTGAYNGKAFLAGYDVYDVKPIYYEVRELDQSQATGYSHPWFLTGKVMIDGKEIALATLHFDWSCKEMRAHQITQVIEYANQHEYAIIIGDVNPDDCIGIPSGGNNHTVLSSNSTHEVDNQLFIDAGYEPANCGRFGTFYTIMGNGVPRSQSPCDNIYVSSNIKILNAQAVYEPWMNDHAIVVADIEIN